MECKKLKMFTMFVLVSLIPIQSQGQDKDLEQEFLEFLQQPQKPVSEAVPDTVDLETYKLLRTRLDFQQDAAGLIPDDDHYQFRMLCEKMWKKRLVSMRDAHPLRFTSMNQLNIYVPYKNLQFEPVLSIDNAAAYSQYNEWEIRQVRIPDFIDELIEPGLPPKGLITYATIAGWAMREYKRHGRPTLKAIRAIAATMSDTERHAYLSKAAVQYVLKMHNIASQIVIRLSIMEKYSLDVEKFNIKNLMTGNVEVMSFDGMSGLNTARTHLMIPNIQFTGLLPDGTTIAVHSAITLEEALDRVDAYNNALTNKHKRTTIERVIENGAKLTWDKTSFREISREKFIPRATILHPDLADLYETFKKKIYGYLHPSAVEYITPSPVIKFSRIVDDAVNVEKIILTILKKIEFRTLADLLIASPSRAGEFILLNFGIWREAGFNDLLLENEQAFKALKNTPLKRFIRGTTTLALGAATLLILTHYVFFNDDLEEYLIEDATPGENPWILSGKAKQPPKLDVKFFQDRVLKPGEDMFWGNPTQFLPNFDGTSLGFDNKLPVPVKSHALVLDQAVKAWVAAGKPQELIFADRVWKP